MRTKKDGPLAVQEDAREEPIHKTVAPSNLLLTCASLSLSLTPETEKIRDELTKVAVLSIIDGFVNEGSVLEVAPTIINRPLAGPITPLSECTFLVILASREEAKEVCKLVSFKVATKDGPCTLKLAPWTAELAEGRASGKGQWVSIWNLPLHGWCWNIIADVVRPWGNWSHFRRRPRRTSGSCRFLFVVAPESHCCLSLNSA